jgi:two-component system, NtrC family, nitrogen regulation sensor histidine kinase NtrY
VRLALPPNPVLLRAAMVLVASTVAFLVGVIFVRALRKKISDEADLTQESRSPEALPMHLYNTVIQQLKQQKHEMHVQSKAEQNRARISETFSQAVLANLSSGVLVFGTNGLIKTTNPAAKQILGFGSTAGMSAKDIFRGAVVRNGETTDDPVRVVEEVEAVLREGSGRRQVEAEYETPGGAKRFIAVTVSPVPAGDGGLLGVTCLINDVSEMARIRREQELAGEVAAEKALELRNSLATISGYARQLASNRDTDLGVQLASDIAHEAANLDRNIGAFLREKRAEQGMAAGAGS